MIVDSGSHVKGRETVVESIDGRVLVSTVRILGLKKPWHETMVLPITAGGIHDYRTELKTIRVSGHENAERVHISACQEYGNPALPNPILSDKRGSFY